MTHCIRCHRPLKRPTETGMGPTCERYVRGSKPKRPPVVSQPVKRDERTADLFEAVAV